MSTQPPTTDILVEDLTIDGPHGPLSVRTYLPETATHGLVWVHGGAFSFGDIDQNESDWVARQLALRGIAVVAVDYQLAPVAEWASAMLGVPTRAGVHYPVASEEVTTAFTWATTLLPTVAAERWSLGGASAGANLATGAALRLRDQGNQSPRSLVLAYGLFHAELPTLSDELAAKYAAQPPELAVFTPEVVQLININYAGEDTALATPYAFPGGHDLTGLPPAFLLNADVDSLRASGDLFGSELAQAGNDILLLREPGTTHGHLDNPQLPAAARSIDRITTWLTGELI